MERILTVPTPNTSDEIVYVTGNHYVSLPHISQDGKVKIVSHLSESTLSLIEYVGQPLLELHLDGSPIESEATGYKHSFIPAFCYEDKDLTMNYSFFAPDGIAGFVVRVELHATRVSMGDISLVFRPDTYLRTIFHSYPLSVQGVLDEDQWTNTGVCQLISGHAISSVAMSGSGDYEVSIDAEGNTMKICHNYSLQPMEKTVLLYYVSVGCERDGACLANMDMRRRGLALYDRTVEQLKLRHVFIPDPVLEERVNLNLNFCYNFSLGYALDSGRLMNVTSKSSRYYVSSAYWARDCMIWAFPTILRCNKAMAREVLLLSFTTYLKEGANHALYVNGRSLYPGFELDQLVAPIIALAKYYSVTNDTEFLLLDTIKQGIHYILTVLEEHRHPELNLYDTELNPSDDPVACRYLIYSNYLVLHALEFIHIHFDHVAYTIDSLKQALSKHAQIEVAGQLILPWAIDVGGRYEIYDNPPGSLLVLPYYGTIKKDDPIYQNTLQYYFSTGNPYYYHNELLQGLGCEHAPAPWPMSLCNLLLAIGPDHKLIESLKCMPMDNGIACETVRVEDGKLHTGGAFATFAGFYANAIIEAFE